MRPNRAIMIHGGTKEKILVYTDGTTKYYCDAEARTQPSQPHRKVRRLEYDTNNNLVSSTPAGNGEYQHPADSLGTVQGLSYL